MQALFACVETSYPKATDAIASAKLTVKLKMREPAAEIVIHGKQKPVKTTFGVDGVKADLEIEMTADTFHHVLMGELPMQKALKSGAMKVKGNIFKAMALGDLIVVSQRCYPEIFRG